MSNLTKFVIGLVLLLVPTACSEYSGEDLQFVEKVTERGGSNVASQIPATDSRTSEVNLAGQVVSNFGLCVLPFIDFTTIDDVGYAETFIKQAFENYLMNLNGVKPVFIGTRDYELLRERTNQSGYTPSQLILNHLRENESADYVLYGKIDIQDGLIFFEPTVVDSGTGEPLEGLEPFLFLSPGESISLELINRFGQYVDHVINTIIKARGI